MNCEDNCHPQARCCNTKGSFVCICNRGYFGDGVNCCRRYDMKFRYASISRRMSKSKSKSKGIFNLIMCFVKKG